MLAGKNLRSDVIRLWAIVALGGFMLAGADATGEATLRQIDWPTYGRDYRNTRHTFDDQINSSNVHSLTLAWTYRLGRYGKFESSPLVIGRTMYVTSGIDDSVVALDATTGAVKWTYAPKLRPANVEYPVNRGVAFDNGKIFLATLDARLIALDARTGKPAWDVQLADPTEGYSETMAPLTWQGMVFVGSAGGERGIRGFVAAYASSSGKELWRWWTVGPGWEGTYSDVLLGFRLHRDVAREKAVATKFRNSWQHGGGAVWMTPALDEARGVLYVAVGNPYPDFNGSTRPGDNLYTDSVVAIDARSGKLKWHYQEVPHDSDDNDAASPPMLIDTIDAYGKRVAAVGEAGKVGWFFELDRDTGRLIRVLDPLGAGKPMRIPSRPSGQFLEPRGYVIAPVAFDPRARRLFILPMAYTASATSQPAGRQILGYPRLTAINVDDGRIEWRRRFPASSTEGSGAPLSAADVVFVGEQGNGFVGAFDATDGQLLWQYRTTAGADEPASGVRRSFTEYVHDVLASIKRWLLRQPLALPDSSHVEAPPIAYEIDGKEYIAVGGGAFYRNGSSVGSTLYVFALPSR